MTIRHKSRLPVFARGGFAALALAGYAVLAGCASNATDTAMPVGPQSGAIDTGTYPNLNVPPQVAAKPLNEEDKARLTSEIASAKSRQSASGRGAGTKGDPARIRKLAEDHGADTLKAIEAQ